MRRMILTLALLALSACAAQSKSAAPASAATDSPAAGSAYAVQPGNSPAPGATAMPQASTTTPPLTPRAAAVQSAVGEIDSSQRELDVAAGDCRNACRALGSMDRAAGRLCGLTQGQPDASRCDDAKQHVYTARDRVKKTCGQCEGGPSVDHDAPIPSLR